MATEKKQTGGDFAGEKKKPAKKCGEEFVWKEKLCKEKETNQAGDEQKFGRN